MDNMQDLIGNMARSLAASKANLKFLPDALKMWMNHGASHGEHFKYSFERESGNINEKEFELLKENIKKTILADPVPGWAELTIIAVPKLTESTFEAPTHLRTKWTWYGSGITHPRKFMTGVVAWLHGQNISAFPDYQKGKIDVTWFSLKDIQ